jgi:lysophospholipase L1-like esterase
VLLKLLLAPCLLWQGWRVRRRTPRLPEADGPRAGWVPAARPLSGPPLGLWVVGDSSAAGVGVSHQHLALAEPLARQLAQRLGRPVAWRLHARSGVTAGGALGLMDGADLSVHPTVLVTVLGVNDVLAGTRPGQWLADLDALVARAQQLAPVRAVLHAGVPPMHRFHALPQPLRWVLGREAMRLDRVLAKHVQTMPGRAHQPADSTATSGDSAGWLALDGFHPGAQAFHLWAAQLAEAIAQVWPAEAGVCEPP